MPIYLDCNATTPLEPDVVEAMRPFWETECGNAGSRTHQFGAHASRAVEHARGQVARVVKANKAEVLFTSGATESNNLAILGLQQFAESSGRRHIVTTEIEHKAVLAPVEFLAAKGFEVTYIIPDGGGRVDAADVLAAVRDDTVLVSIMHVNNETGVEQPVNEIAEGLKGCQTIFHTDAAQGFGKVSEALQNKRIDLISISAHKIYGPKGIGALVMRRRPSGPIGLQPMILGGGQERGLRAGTAPVPLIVGFGVAAELAQANEKSRRTACRVFKKELLEAVAALAPKVHGDPSYVLPNVINMSFPGVDSEALMLVLRDDVAISNGSACTSAAYSPSHVLKAMGLSNEEAEAATRWSWSHMTPIPQWDRIVSNIRRLL